MRRFAFGHLDADRLLAGDRREDPHVGGGQRVGEVVLEVRDLGDLDPRRQPQLVARDVRAGRRARSRCASMPKCPSASSSPAATRSCPAVSGRDLVGGSSASAGVRLGRRHGKRRIVGDRGAVAPLRRQLALDRRLGGALGVRLRLGPSGFAAIIIGLVGSSDLGARSRRNSTAGSIGGASTCVARTIELAVLGLRRCDRLGARAALRSASARLRAELRGKRTGSGVRRPRMLGGQRSAARAGRRRRAPRKTARISAPVAPTQARGGPELGLAERGRRGCGSSDQSARCAGPAACEAERGGGEEQDRSGAQRARRRRAAGAARAACRRRRGRRERRSRAWPNSQPSPLAAASRRPRPPSQWP